jgi:hypothetical protein
MNSGRAIRKFLAHIDSRTETENTFIDYNVIITQRTPKILLKFKYDTLTDYSYNVCQHGTFRQLVQPSLRQTEDGC